VTVLPDKFKNNAITLCVKAMAMIDQEAKPTVFLVGLDVLQHTNKIATFDPLSISLGTCQHADITPVIRQAIKSTVVAHLDPAHRKN
jgi:hypothetical protein